MADQSNRLTTKGLTIADVIKLSWRYYKSKDGDDKNRRSKLDIKSARVTKRNNYEYNPSTKSWEQVGRNVKLEFLVMSDPKSYKKTDNVKIHKYPVTFLISDIDKGIFSTFRWRVGSLKKPIFSNPSMTSQQIGERNIRNGCQMQFIYELMFILKKHNLLYGINYTSRPPTKTNPKGQIFFDKHAWWIIRNILIKLLGTDGGKLKTSLYKNE